MKWIAKFLKALGIFILAIAVLLVVSIWLLDYMSESHRKNYFQDRDRIERITGVALPKFKMTNYSEGNRGLTGEYMDFIDFEFKNPLPDELFDEIDVKIEEGNTGWSKEGNKYTFGQSWGNGIPAPKGESDDEDRFFYLTLVKGSKEGKINHGVW